MTLFEIIEAVKNGEKPPYEELRYAVAALDGLSTFDHMQLVKLAEGQREGKKPILIWSAVFQEEERFKRWRLALSKRPKEWLGSTYDPDNPEYQQRRRSALKLFDHVTKKIAEAKK